MVDGNSTGTSSSIPAADADSLRFAAGFNSPYAGLMDEIRVWNVERTVSDIATTMRIPLAGKLGYLYRTSGSMAGELCTGRFRSRTN